MLGPSLARALAVICKGLEHRVKKWEPLFREIFVTAKRDGQAQRLLGARRQK
jgi:hypothetical protein